MVKKNTCVFISGKGTNLKNLIIKSRSYNCPISIKLVICNKEKATGIKYAKKNSIPYLLVNTNSRDFERKILLSLKKYKISLICLAGYMKILSREFLKNFRKKIINIHPSLLPKFKGLDTFAKVLKNKEVKTGCTVHYVDEKLDNGKNIVQKSFFINSNDDIYSLQVKTQQLEYIAYPEAITKIFRYTNF